MIITHPPSKLISSIIDTPIGMVQAIANDKNLYLLEFVDCRELEKEIKRLTFIMQTEVSQGNNTIVELLRSELKDYFAGQLKKFTIPISLMGSSFQKLAWKELIKIPYGDTISYMQQAINIKKPLSYRAVANSNGANKIAIIIPCHRVTNNNGKIGGYKSGVERKRWLINHEANNNNLYYTEMLTCI